MTTGQKKRFDALRVAIHLSTSRSGGEGRLWKAPGPRRESVMPLAWKRWQRDNRQARNDWGIRRD